MCSLAPHPNVNKWHNMKTFSIFHTDWLYPSSELGGIHRDGGTMLLSTLPQWNKITAKVSSNEGTAIFEKTPDVWDLRFSQHRTWRVHSLGIWCDVDWYISDILEILSASTFRISTWCHIPKYCKFNFLSRHWTKVSDSIMPKWICTLKRTLDGLQKLFRVGSQQKTPYCY